MRNAIVSILLLLSLPAAALTVGQIDTFQDGTTQGWLVAPLGAPHPAPPVNVPDGGPGGAGDAYLLITSVGGSGPGSRLVILNGEQWAGDYLTAGVGGIALDLLNLSAQDLSIRFLLEDPADGPPQNVALTGPATVPAGAGWTTVQIPLTVDTLTAVEGTVEAALAGATFVRILHNPDPTFPPPPVVAQLGIDNVTALSGVVPVQAATWGAVKSLFD
jgi:hypothetical protein